MRNRIVLMCVLSAMLAPASFSQTSAPSETNVAADTASIVGVWRGVWGGDGGGLPCISLTLSNETGNLSGAILFYLFRKDQGQAATSTPGDPVPLIDPKFDGKTLTFEVSRRFAHPPGTLNDPPISFRFTLTGANKGSINNVSEPVGDGTGSAGIEMVRTD